MGTILPQPELDGQQKSQKNSNNPDYHEKLPSQNVRQAAVPPTPKHLKNQKYPQQLHPLPSGQGGKRTE